MGEAYIRQLKDLDSALKNYTLKMKQLRDQKKQVNSNLYNFMIKHNLEEYQGIKLQKITPKEKVKRKKAKEKKEDALKLFYEIGIQNPESFWESLQKTQKPKTEEGEEDNT